MYNKIKYQNKFLILLLISMFMTLSLEAEGFVKSIARGYCALSHPVEMLTPIRHNNTCEEQHVIQQ